MFRVARTLSVPENSSDEISMDFIVGLLERDGFDATWMVVDWLLKMRHFVLSHTMIDASGLTMLFLWKVVRLHAHPVTIVSDWGLQFASGFWGQLCNCLRSNTQCQQLFIHKSKAEKSGWMGA